MVRTSSSRPRIGTAPPRYSKAKDSRYQNLIVRQRAMDERFDAMADKIIEDYNKVCKQIKATETRLENLKEKKAYLTVKIDNFNKYEARSTQANNRRRHGVRNQRSMNTRVHRVERDEKYGVEPRRPHYY